MSTLRRLAAAALGLAIVHSIFGAIVRISGSGLGCGEHWPRCYGRWFPPFDQPTLVIEWTHRLLALLLILAIAGFAIAAYRRRAEPGVGGRGGVLRAAAAAFGLVIVTALFGAATVKLGTPPATTVIHWFLATMLLATLMTALLRTGAGSTEQAGSRRTARAALVAAVLVLLTVLLGGLTAKLPGASTACLGFPHCSQSVTNVGGGLHLHLTHRVLAFLVFFHVMGLLIGVTRRKEARSVVRAAQTTFGLAATQLVIAAVMLTHQLPPVLRSLHQATGILLWLAVYSLAWLARRAAQPSDARLNSAA